MHSASVFKYVSATLKAAACQVRGKHLRLEGGIGASAQPHTRPRTHSLSLTQRVNLIHCDSSMLSCWLAHWLSCFCLGDDEENENGEMEPKMPTCGDYILHFLTLFWKLLFAFVPPTGILYCRARLNPICFLLIGAVSRGGGGGGGDPHYLTSPPRVLHFHSCHFFSKLYFTFSW